MWLIWIGVTLLLLHLAGLGPFAEMKWYWWALPFALAFIWFEFIERPLGLDRKRGHDELEKSRKSRIKAALGDHADKGKSRR